MQQNRLFPLYLTNFLSVFNDNLLKNSIIFVAVAWTLPHAMTHSQLIAAASAALVLPYIFFAPLSGVLSERYQRTTIVRLFKLIELPIIAVAIVGFLYKSVFVVLFALLLTGVKCCLFSPSKYGLIRDVGGESRVAAGSGIFEAMAFIGILTGTVAASTICDHYRVWVLAALLMGVAVAGYFSARSIRASEQPATSESTANPIRFLVEAYRIAKTHKLNKYVFGACLLWFLGSLIQMNLVIHCKQILLLSATQTGLVMAAAAIGIALGTSIAGRFMSEKTSAIWICSGVAGTIAALAALLFLPAQLWTTVLFVILLAFCGGMFQVPCLATIQRADLGRQSGVIFAFINFITFALILFGSLLFSLVTAWTNENSYAVFLLMLVIQIVVLVGYIWVFRRESKKRTVQ